MGKLAADRRARVNQLQVARPVSREMARSRSEASQVFEPR